MKSCLEKNATVYLSINTNPRRKTRYTWEMIFINNGWVGINTLLPNRFVFEGLRQKAFPELSGFRTFKKEVKFGDSRFDIYAENHSEKCFIEIKNVTLKQGQFALFPDAVSERGRKHLQTLMQAKSERYRAVMFYLIQRTDVDLFSPAWPIDPAYANTLSIAVDRGVEVLPYRVKVNPYCIELDHKLPFEITPKST